MAMQFSSFLRQNAINKHLLQNEANLQKELDEIASFQLYLSTVTAQARHQEDVKSNSLINDIKSTESKIEELQTKRRIYAKEKERCLLDIEKAKENIAVANEGLAEYEIQKEQYELDLKNANDILVEKYNAFNKANNIFKSNLECYIEIEDPEDTSFLVAFFTKVRMATWNYYIKLDFNGTQWTLLETKPVLSCHKALENKLSETGDISGFLCVVRNLFLKHKENAAKTGTNSLTVQMSTMKLKK